MPRRHYSFEFWATPKLIMERTDLSLEDKAVLSVLITRYNGESPLKIKQETIAKYIGVSTRTVMRSLKKLKDKKFIEIGQSWKLNTYMIKDK